MNRYRAWLAIGLILACSVVTFGGMGKVKVSVSGSGFPNPANETLNMGTEMITFEDVSLVRDAANVLAQRNGTNAQALRIYNTFTDASNYERLALIPGATATSILQQEAGSGSARTLLVGTAGAANLDFYTTNTARWRVSSAGHLLAVTDNSFDIGADGATRPRDVYIADDMEIGGQVIIGGTSVDADAALQVDSTSATFLPPRMTEAQRDAIAGPNAGSIIYNSDTGLLNFRDGSGWNAIAAGGAHAILSATHSDSVASAVSRGSLIYGNSTPAWAELTIGAAGTYLRSDGTDVSWSPRTDGVAVTLTDAATIATDASAGMHFTVTLGGNRTLGNPTNPANKMRRVWEFIQDGTGSRTISLGNDFSFGTDITGVTLSTASGTRDFMTAIYDSTSTQWYVVGFAKGY